MRGEEEEGDDDGGCCCCGGRAAEGGGGPGAASASTSASPPPSLRRPGTRQDDGAAAGVSTRRWSCTDGPPLRPSLALNTQPPQNKMAAEPCVTWLVLGSAPPAPPPPAFPSLSASRLLFFFFETRDIPSEARGGTRRWETGTASLQARAVIFFPYTVS